MKAREGAELIRWSEEANGDLNIPLSSAVSDSGDFNVSQQRRRSSKRETTLLSIRNKRKFTSKNIKPVQHIKLRASFRLISFSVTLRFYYSFVHVHGKLRVKCVGNHQK